MSEMLVLILKECSLYKKRTNILTNKNGAWFDASDTQNIQSYGIFKFIALKLIFS